MVFMFGGLLSPSLSSQGGGGERRFRSAPSPPLEERDGERRPIPRAKMLPASWYLRPARKPILSKWISRIRITPDFPKPEDIPIKERYLAYKLSSFPGVALRNNDPRRS